MKLNKHCIVKWAALGFACAILLLMGCKQSLKKESLLGDWKYIKVDKPKSDDPTDTVSTADLLVQAPYITFTANNELIIQWGGKILSHGTYVITDDNINYTEQLMEGGTRTFPFYVSKLDDKNIIFETTGKDGSRVVAVKK